MILGLATLGLLGCGDDANTDRQNRAIADAQWETVVDPDTGNTFRCLYINDGYTSEFICYSPDTGVTVGG